VYLGYALLFSWYLDYLLNIYILEVKFGFQGIVSRTPASKWTYITLKKIKNKIKNEEEEEEDNKKICKRYKRN
jgi:hypothetical protein